MVGYIRGKRKHTVLNKRQKDVLMSEFRRNPFLSFELEKSLPVQLGLSQYQVTNWFKGQRHAVRTLSHHVQLEGTHVRELFALQISTEKA